MKSRKVLSIILAVLLSSALTACKGNNNVDAPSEIDVPNECISTPDTPDTPDSADNAKPDSDSAAKNKKKSAAVKPVKKDTDSSSDKDNSSDEDTQNPIMNYVGPYACERASMNVRAKNEKDAEITIKWSSSASAYSTWSLSGTLNTDTMTAEYDNCKKTNAEVNEYGLTISETTAYENGRGRIVFHEDGTITWEDDEENIASGMTFRFNGEHEEISDSDSDSSDSDSKYISRGKAIAKVKEQAGWDTTVISAFEGYTPDGIEAWIVSVAPNTNSYDDKFITYYVNDQLCYTDDVIDSDSDSDTDDSTVYADISENKAIAKVKEQAGSNVGVYSSFEGYSPDGNEAWVITVSPESDDVEFYTVTYYVSSSFCYSE